MRHPSENLPEGGKTSRLVPRALARRGREAPTDP